MEDAASSKKPILIFFMGEGDSDSAYMGDEIASISKDSVIFVRVPHTDNRELDPWAEETVVPTNKLLSDNPARDFEVKVGQRTWIFCDPYGNEMARSTKEMKGSTLKAQTKKVEKFLEKNEKDLKKCLEKAQEAEAEKDVKKMMKYLLKNFKSGLYGYDSQEATTRMYHDQLDSARGEIAELTEAADEASIDKLKDMAKMYKKTDLEKEIDEAIETIKG